MLLFSYAIDIHLIKISLFLGHAGDGDKYNSRRFSHERNVLCSGVALAAHFRPGFLVLERDPQRKGRARHQRCRYRRNRGLWPR